MLIAGHAGQLPLQDNSVQCVVTSPPYWGLRKYAGEQELIWNGHRGTEGTENCEHDWNGEKVPVIDPVSGAGAHWQHKEPHNIGPDEYDVTEFRKADRRFSSVGTCRKCGAWRGAYGLEPTVELYVQHTIEILREIRRVLRPDGVVFWNIGDSYAGSWGNYGARSGQQRSRISELWHRPGYENQGDRTLPPTARISKSKRIERGTGRWGGGNNYDAALKPKDLCLIPQRLALAAQADGWWVRSDIIWAKPNPMPESVTDRPTDAYEHILMLTKSARYFWDADAVKEAAEYGYRPTTGEMFARKGRADAGPEKTVSTTSGKEEKGRRNPRNVWTFPTQPYSGAHFATFPEELPRRCILVGTSAKGACRFCGAPWERIIESQTRFESGSGKAGNPPMGKYAGSEQAESGDYDIRMGPVIESQTIGWRPTCACRGQRARTLPCVVLDPFAGSGTTGRVAIELNRTAILVDLAYGWATTEDLRKGTAYAPLADKRTRNVQRNLL